MCEYYKIVCLLFFAIRKEKRSYMKYTCSKRVAVEVIKTNNICERSTLV